MFFLSLVIIRPEHR